MIFTHFLTASNESNAFLVACETTRKALLVDAGAFEPAIAEFVDEHGLTLETVFITHGHYDHTDGLDGLVARYRPRIVARQTPCAGHTADVVGHGDTVSVGNLKGTVLATPGHTPDMVCLHFDGMVFTGDALFAGSVGGTSGATAEQQQLDAIRKHIFTLPLETEIHTGHGPSSTVSIEKQFNPFFVE